MTHTALQQQYRVDSILQLRDRSERDGVGHGDELPGQNEGQYLLHSCVRVD